MLPHACNETDPRPTPSSTNGASCRSDPKGPASPRPSPPNNAFPPSLGLLHHGTPSSLHEWGEKESIRRPPRPLPRPLPLLLPLPPRFEGTR